MMELRVLACAYACLSESGVRVTGGEAVLGWNLVKQLGLFHRVWVLTHTDNRSAIEAAQRQQILHNVRFQYVDLPRWLRPLQRFHGGIQFYAYLWQVRACLVARELHREFRFHLFHHLTYANDWMASFIGALLPIPFVRGPGGGAHQTPKGFLREFSLSGCLAEQLRAVAQWVLRRDPIFRLGLRRARVILVCNREALEALPARWRHKAQLFPVNGVSASDLAVSFPARKSNERFYVLSAGKLLRIKGFDLAIKAFKVFVDRCPKAEFTVVGDGPELSRLSGLVRMLRLQTQVRIESWMARERLLAEMRSCDVFLFPSLRDGGGAVVVEAMAAGKAVICFDIGGPGLHITDGCGIKLPARNREQAVNDIAVALERLYKDEDLRRQLGRAARERAEHVYHWDRLGDRLRGIYAETLGCTISPVEVRE